MVNTTGTVKRLVNSRQRTSLVVPEVEYFDNVGNKYLERGKIYTHNSQYEVGDTISIFYKSNNPHKMTIDDNDSTYTIPFLITFIGMGVLIFNVLTIFYLKRKSYYSK